MIGYLILIALVAVIAGMAYLANKVTKTLDDTDPRSKMYHPQ